MILPTLNKLLSLQKDKTLAFNQSAIWHRDREFKHGRGLDQNCLNSEKKFHSGAAGGENTSGGYLFH